MKTSLVKSVVNNTERGGELVLASQQFFISMIIFIYATSVNVACVYTKLCLRKLAYILQTYDSVNSSYVFL